MILNNCTTCGGITRIGNAPIIGFYCQCCKCGKTVSSVFNCVDLKEVAADMWNLANQVEKKQCTQTT